MLFFTRDFAKLFFISSLVFSSIILSTSDVESASTTPSVTLPDVFQRPENRTFNKFEKKNLPLSKIQNLKDREQSDEGFEIISNTLIILAPKELQQKVDFTKYQQQVIGIPKSIKDFYNIAADIQKEFKIKGFPLVRVIVPKQELELENATVFLKVIGGFVVPLGIFGVVPIAGLVAVMGLEFLIAFLQAYIFTILTCIYINDAIHLH